MRLVTVADAEFIYGLRQEASLNTHLSRAPETVADQRGWLSAYALREQAGEEYYFIIEGADGPLGTVRLYRFTSEGHFTWGSWVIRRAAPIRAGIHSALMIYALAFETLKLKESRFEVRKCNARVIAFHERCGAELVGENELELLFRFSQGAYLNMKARYS